MAVKQETKIATKTKTSAKSASKTMKESASKADSKSKDKSDSKSKSNSKSKSKNVLSTFTPEAKLIIHNPKTDARLAYGPGVATLCYGIREYGTLAEAASRMGISYSKAWKIVGECEEIMGVQLIVRKKPQGCWLTPLGDELLTGYMQIQEKISAEADKLFDKIFC